MKTITTIEEVLAVVDPDTVILDSRGRSYQWSLTLSDGDTEGWCSVDDPTPITSHHLVRLGPLRVIHCTIPTAADQPTTEPSAVERAAETLDRAWSEYRQAADAWIEDKNPQMWDDPPTPPTSFDLAQVLADAGLLAPAPQPAADTETETEVQWGVRREDGKVAPYPSEERARQALAHHRFWHADSTRSLMYSVTPVTWEEA